MMTADDRKLFESALAGFMEWFGVQFEKLEAVFGPSPGGDKTIGVWAGLATGHEMRAVEAAIAKLMFWRPEYGKKWPVLADFRDALPSLETTDEDETIWSLLLELSDARQPFEDVPEVAARAVGGADGYRQLRALIDDGRTGSAYRRLMGRQRKLRAALPPSRRPAALLAPPPRDRGRIQQLLAAVSSSPEPSAASSLARRVLTAGEAEAAAEARAIEGSNPRPPGWAEEQRQALRQAFAERDSTEEEN
jgi:hypothetical protein